MSAIFAINKWSTEELISFLKNKNLCLDDEDFQVLHEQKIDGYITIHQHNRTGKTNANADVLSRINKQEKKNSLIYI
jgi:hypothetical protein